MDIKLFIKSYMIRLATGLLSLDSFSFTPKLDRELDQKIVELKKAFLEPFSIERQKDSGKPYIRVLFAEPHDSTRDLAEIEAQIRKETGNLPIKFEVITYRSISKLFAGLEALVTSS